MPNPQFPTRNDISAANRKTIVALLNPLLADLSDLHSQTKHAHWNIRGANFYSVHLLLDELAEKLDGFIDDVAERITTLGGVALGGIKNIAEHTRLPAYPDDAFEVSKAIAATADVFAQVAKSARKGIDSAEEANDAVTADLLTEVASELDKSVWFLEAHLQKA